MQHLIIMQEVYSETTEFALSGDKIAKLNEEKGILKAIMFSFLTYGMCF